MPASSTRAILTCLLTFTLSTLLGCRSHSADRSSDVAQHAIPSDTGHHVGYQVGGGSARPHRAEPGAPDEGTWGWDYSGWLIHRRVMNGWWHGRREQGGTGAYKTDGPRYQETRHETSGEISSGGGH